MILSESSSMTFIYMDPPVCNIRYNIPPMVYPCARIALSIFHHKNDVVISRSETCDIFLFVVKNQPIIALGFWERDEML